MELIRPSEVTGKILSLIEDAKKELIIVSPYNKFGHWDKLKRFLNEARERKIRIDFYAREDGDNTCLKTVGVQPILIKMLHAKLYMNESYAILSSMNLIQASDEKALDFALITTTPEQYAEVRKYFEDYIRPKAPTAQVFQQKNIELPYSEYFASQPRYENKKLELNLVYHNNSRFIKEFGHLAYGKKFGEWYYFNSDGLLEKVEKYWDRPEKEQLYYNNKTSRYYLLFTMANVVSGLFQCSIKDFYFKSYLKDFVRDDPEKFFNHLKSIFGLPFLDYNAKYAEDLVDEIHEGLYNKTKLSKF